MHIDNTIIKHYLRNVYFINGTAYAGKSTVCKALAEKHDMIHCGENYGFNKFLSLTTPKTHPNMNYFKTMDGWEAYVSRSKESYDAWMENTARELIEFEIMELVSLTQDDKKIIVDTNIPHDVLKEIAAPDHAVYMVATPEIASESFFKRSDPDKQFLLEVLKNTDNPEQAISHYKEIVRHVNREEKNDGFRQSGFPVIERKTIDEPIDDKILLAERYFRLGRGN